MTRNSSLFVSAAVLALRVVPISDAAEPRTAGYWVQWSTCSGGDRAELASRNAGDVDGDGVVDAGDRAAAGWVLLDDLLERPGIVWDDGQEDDVVVRIDTCEDAVAILERRALDAGEPADEDAAFTVAMQLLAAQLNVGAGTGSCPEAANAMIMAEDLLDTVDFDGTRTAGEGAGRVAPYLQPGDGLFERATELAELLGRYNLGQLCPP